MRLKKTAILNRPTLFKNTFSKWPTRVIKGEELKEVYKYNPVAVDIAEDFMSNETIEYGPEYKDFKCPMYYLMSDDINDGTLVPAISEQIDTAYACPVRVKLYKVAKYRPALKDEIQRYIISNGGIERQMNHLKYTCLQDLSEETKTYARFEFDKFDNYLYVYDWEAKAYKKKLCGISYLRKYIRGCDEDEYTVVFKDRSEFLINQF